MNYLHLVVFLSTVLPGIHGFASWMTSDFCRRELRLGEVIMNEEVVFSDLRLVEVYRDGVALRSNQDKFVLGETLTVKISDSRNQYVYEVSGNKEASFVDGGCDGRRIADKKEVKLQLPEKNDQDSVTIVVAWAAGPEAVKLSPTFVLLPPGAVDSSEKDKDTDSQTAVLPSSDLSQNHTIDIKEALVSASNLRGREEPLQHIKSTEKKVDDRIQEVITAFSKKKEIQLIGSSGEDRKEEKEEVVYNPNKKRRFKNMRERVLFKAAVYIALGAIGFFALAFVIRYRHNLYRLVRKWLGGKVHDEEQEGKKAQYKQPRDYMVHESVAVV